MDNIKATVIVDLDGTLADCSHRRHFLDGDSPDWDAFYDACGKDTPNGWCVTLINSLVKAEVPVTIVSARRQAEYQKTLAWLVEAGISGDVSVSLLRPDRDYTPDNVLKQRWLEGFGKDNVLFVVDDRPKVIRMWRAEGVKVLDCGDGVEF
jgi:hypothetical protein